VETHQHPGPRNSEVCFLPPSDDAILGLEGAHPSAQSASLKDGQ